MRCSTVLALVVVASIIPSLAAAQSTPPETPTDVPTTLYGVAELSPGVPCAGCKVVAEGTPLGSTTDANGFWAIPNVPTGVWTLRLTSTSYSTLISTLATRTICGGASTLEFGDKVRCELPPLARPGAISGRVTFGTATDYDTAVIAVPDLGIFTQANCGGGYLLTGVPPGWRKVVVTTNATTKELMVYVNPAQVTMKQNFVFPSVVTSPGA